MIWKIWYADGSIVTSETHRWIDAPSTGVQVVILYYPDGHRMVAHGADGYILANDKVWGIQLPIPEFQKVAEALAKQGRLKFGLAIPDPDYERIHNEAMATWQ